jgi:hypothetical protein
VSDVVIRCPNCGTTQQTLGECEACHEADTRYFCPNHAPGRWLDGPACAACGAHFTGRTAGVPPAPPAPPPVARPPRDRARPVDPIPPAPMPPRSRRVPAPPPMPPREPVDVGGGWVEVDDRAPWPPARRPRGPRDLGDPRDARDPYDPRDPRDPRWPSEFPLPTVRVGIGSVFGCLGRLVTGAIVLLVLAALAFFGYCGTPMGFAGEGAPRATHATHVTDGAAPSILAPVPRPPAAARGG